MSGFGDQSEISRYHESACAEGTLECGSSSYRLLMFPSLGVRKSSRFLLYTLRCRTKWKGGSCCCRTPKRFPMGDWPHSPMHRFTGAWAYMCQGKVEMS